MKYIKESFSTLKTRWPEVAMLIGLALALGVLNMNFFTIEKNNASPLPANVFLFLVITVFFLLFKLGFLSTAHQSKDQPQQPLALLKEGKRFLWRFVLLGMLYATVYFAATLVILPFFASRDAIISNPEKLLPVLEKVSLINYIIISFVLMKFIIFLPALVIVTDVTVPSSLGLLKYCKLKDAKALVVLFLTQMAINIMWMLLPDFGMESIYQKILLILPAIVNQGFTLIIAVAAIRFVDDLNLLYDSENESESDLTEGEN